MTSWTLYDYVISVFLGILTACVLYGVWELWA